MDDFYKKIKEHQSFDKEHEMDESAWDSFKNYQVNQENESNSRKGFFFWPVAAGILFLLMGSVGIYSYQKTGHVLGHMLELQRDTIYITKIVEIEKDNLDNNKLIEKDLGFRTTQLAKLQSEHAQLSRSFERLQLDHFELTNVFDEIKESILANKSKMRNVVPLEQVQIKDPIIKDNVDRDIFNDSKIHLISVPEVQTASRRVIEPFIDILPDRRVGKKSFGDIIRPKTFSIGVDLGISSPSLYYNTSNALQLKGGVLISSMFTQRIRGQIAFEYGQYLAEEPDPQQNSQIPQITPPENGTLKEVKINRSAFVGQIGLEYILLKGRKWRPFVGISVGREGHLYPSFKYEFDTPDGEIYLQLDTELPTDYATQYGGNVGLEYYIFNQWNIQLQSTYKYSRIYQSELGLKTRVIYHF